MVIDGIEYETVLTLDWFGQFVQVLRPKEDKGMAKCGCGSPDKFSHRENYDGTHFDPEEAPMTAEQEGPYTDNGKKLGDFKYKLSGPGVDEEMLHLQLATISPRLQVLALLNFGYAQGRASMEAEIKALKNLLFEAKELEDKRMAKLAKAREAVKAAIDCHEAAERGESSRFPIEILREAFAAADKAQGESK